jgi:cob(I)alamin adenosyltransferase
MADNLERLQKIKIAKDASHDRRKGNERGLYLLFTGLGKGKTSSAMNLVYRHLAHNLSVAVVQFVKNSEAYPDGDRLFLSKLKSLGYPIEFHTLGAGFTWETQDAQKDQAAALEAWQTAEVYIKDPAVNLVVLDELHIAIKHQQIDVETVLPVIQNRPFHCHVASTGRYAPQALIDYADLVSEIKLVKHPIAQGIPAQFGIEF